jgi:hypothetical protein
LLHIQLKIEQQNRQSNRPRSQVQGKGRAVITTYTTKDGVIETQIKPTEISGSAEGQAVIATYTTKDRGTKSPIKPTEISGSGEG